VAATKDAWYLRGASRNEINLIFHNAVGVTDLLELNLRQLKQETINIIRQYNGGGRTQY
jgi:hypothetical protein